MRFWEAIERMLSEVSEDNLSKIEKRAAKFAAKNFKKQPFNDIFGDKSRIVIPLGGEDEVEFMKFLEENGLSGIDLDRGIGERETKTNQGVKKQPVKIGKFLQVLSKEDHDADKWLSWWEKNKSKLKEDRNVSIVISRHPIDVLRMSDHQGIKSCHSQGGSWFHCAVEEAKTGGAVAMVVKNDDLDKTDLSSDEIFADPQRKIPGIVPLERLRLRRFEDDKHDYLVPELRTYGKDHPGTLETVTRWARQEQSDKLQDVDWKKLKLRGGGYQDNDADDVWNNLVGKTQFAGTKNSEDQSKEDKDLEERAQRLIAAKELKHFDVQSELMVDDGRPFLTNRFSISFEFPESEIAEWPNEDYKKQREVSKTIRDEVDIYTLSDEAYFHYHNGRYFVGIEGYDEDDHGDLQGLERLLDYVKDLDNNYEKHREEVRGALIQSGVLKNPVADLNLQNLEEIETRKGAYGDERISMLRGLTKHSYQAIGDIGDLTGIPKSAVQFKKDGFIYARKQPNQFYAQSVADFYMDSKLNNALSSKMTEEENKAIKDGKIHYRVEFSVEDENHDVPHFDVNPNEEFSKGNVIVVLDVDTRNLDSDVLAVLKKLDTYFPAIIAEAKKDWQHFKSSAVEKEEGGVSRASAHLGRTIADHIESLHIPGGTVSVKNGVYWYDNPTNGISMPANQFDSMMKKFKDENRGAKYAGYRFESMGRKGEVVLRFIKGQPVYVWNDSIDGELPIDKALDFYQHKK